MPSLHDQAWNGWQNSRSQQPKDAKATPEHIAAAKAIITEDSTAITEPDAADIAAKWDSLLMEVAEYNGHGLFDMAIVLFNPFEDRFSIVTLPEQGVR